MKLKVAKSRGRPTKATPLASVATALGKAKRGRPPKAQGGTPLTLEKVPTELVESEDLRPEEILDLLQNVAGIARLAGVKTRTIQRENARRTAAQVPLIAPGTIEALEYVIDSRRAKFLIEPKRVTLETLPMVAPERVVSLVYWLLYKTRTERSVITARALPQPYEEQIEGVGTVTRTLDIKFSKVNHGITPGRITLEEIGRCCFEGEKLTGQGVGQWISTLPKGMRDGIRQMIRIANDSLCNSNLEDKPAPRLSDEIWLEEAGDATCPKCKAICFDGDYCFDCAKNPATLQSQHVRLLEIEAEHLPKILQEFLSDKAPGALESIVGGYVAAMLPGAKRRLSNERRITGKGEVICLGGRNARPDKYTGKKREFANLEITAEEESARCKTNPHIESEMTRQELCTNDLVFSDEMSKLRSEVDQPDAIGETWEG